jgi:hypothetical protein
MKNTTNDYIFIYWDDYTINPKEQNDIKKNYIHKCRT